MSMGKLINTDDEWGWGLINREWKICLNVFFHFLNLCFISLRHCKLLHFHLDILNMLQGKALSKSEKFKWSITLTVDCASICAYFETITLLYLDFSLSHQLSKKTQNTYKVRFIADVLNKFWMGSIFYNSLIWYVSYQTGIFPANPRTLFVGNFQSHRKS